MNLVIFDYNARARLAQSVERKALNLVVVGSSPTVGVSIAVVIVWSSCARRLAKLFQVVIHCER